VLVLMEQEDAFVQALGLMPGGLNEGLVRKGLAKVAARLPAGGK
jgi:hypothetical protein